MTWKPNRSDDVVFLPGRRSVLAQTEFPVQLKYAAEDSSMRIKLSYRVVSFLWILLIS